MSQIISLWSQPESPVVEHMGPTLVFQDPKLLASLREAKRATDLKLPVLLLGESGTGKEYLGREIHRRSGRHGSFVPVNCAALPEPLAFAELFGHAEGAYTGARRGGAEGRIAEADMGTLMLDEIGDMPMSLQVTLLRFLDDFLIRPLGRARERKVDVQVIAATNVDLDEAVERGTFRRDLLYRLNTIEIRIPPLRERQDFAEIVRSQWAAIPGAPALEPSAIRRLSAYSWAGNMRELKGILYRLAFRYPEQDITDALVDAVLPSEHRCKAPQTTLNTHSEGLIRDALQHCGGNVSIASRRLGLSRSTMYRYLAKMPSEP
jgi:sigma-54 dependent transcriptional regulator, acetoin dehydrogenase operon transcriptional activator AcoR